MQVMRVEEDIDIVSKGWLQCGVPVSVATDSGVIAGYDDASTHILHHSGFSATVDVGGHLEKFPLLHSLLCATNFVFNNNFTSSSDVPRGEDYSSERRISAMQLNLK